MKKTARFALLALLCTAAFTFTSCLSDDDNQDDVTTAAMTEAEIQQYLTPIQGYHIGNLKAYFQNAKGEQDSVVVSAPCTVSTNKTITFADFPVSILKNYFPEVENENDNWPFASIIARKDLREALEAMDDMPLIAKMTAFWSFKNNTTGQSSQLFYVIPENKRLEFSFTVGDKKHEAVINFTEALSINYTSFYSQGFYTPNTYKLRMQFIINDFSVDGYAMMQYASLSYSDN